MYERDYSTGTDRFSATMLRLTRLLIYVPLFLASGYIWPIKVILLILKQN